MCKTLNTMFKAVKRNRKLAKAWKIAADTPIHKKGEKKLVENYRPVSLLNIESKIFEKCIYEELSAHFTKFLSSKQQGFIQQRSVYTSMLLFLKKIYEALDKKVQSCRILYWFCEGIRSCTPLRTSIKSRANWHWRLSPWSLIWLSQRTGTICQSGQHQIKKFTSDKRGPTGITARVDPILHIHQRTARCPQIWRTLYVCGWPKNTPHWNTSRPSTE